MAFRPYPIDLDCVWLASDADGNVAVFVTGGVAPIPYVSLRCDLPAPEDLEERLLELPRKRNEMGSTVDFPQQSFMELAMRGLFVYDWSNVHRTRSNYIDGYELVCAPAVSIRTDQFTGELLAAVSEVSFALRFVDNQIVDVAKFIRCIQVSRQ